ncbi:ferredoxin [Nonomuraea dietziae]|uniref:ferredoxin n=1 Tax=Nonomuraea dietziae TaxID=65515 RepID=UPI003CD0AF26
MKIKVDYLVCEANAVCMGLAPEVFEVDDEDQLHVLLPRAAARDGGRRVPPRGAVMSESRPLSRGVTPMARCAAPHRRRRQARHPRRRHAGSGRPDAGAREDQGDRRLPLPTCRR